MILPEAIKIRNTWKDRIKQCGITEGEFFKRYDINRATFYKMFKADTLKSASLNTIIEIDNKVTELEENS